MRTPTFIQLVLVLAAVSFGVVTITSYSLYRTAWRQQEVRLREKIREKVNLLESVARFDAEHTAHHFEGGGFEATFSQIAQAHAVKETDPSLDENLYAIARDGEIVFLLSDQARETELLQRLPMDESTAHLPIRHALAGQSGLTVATDYRGERVLAAYGYVRPLRLGVVSKIDVADIRAPFIRAGFWALIAGAALIALGTFAIYHIVNPAIARLQTQTQDLEQENTRRREAEERIRESQMTAIFALAKLAESRDDETGRHIERVQTFCRILAERLAAHPRFRDQIDPEFVENVFYAAPLHDIGKVGISDDILLKPGRLTDKEFEIMKSHTVIGSRTLEAVRERYPDNEFIHIGLDIARSHHERWDGAGYPDGLKGSRIPLAARILAVADAYDALRSVRSYKLGQSHQETCEIIFSDSGAHFDPDIIEAFAAVADEFEATYKLLTRELRAAG